MKVSHFEGLLTLTGALMGLGSVFFFIPLFCVLEVWVVEDCGVFEDPEYRFVFLFIAPIPIIAFIFLVYYRFTLYADDSMFFYGYKKGNRVARKCKICAKHPMHQKFHAKKFHNLKITKLEENFEDCGCEFCVSRKIDWSAHGGA